MSWETRKRGGRYYTRSRREAGRVVREYIGGGALGQLTAEADARKRLERQKRAQAWQTERIRTEATNSALVRFYNSVEALVRSSLYMAGYHRHQRGEWRRRREENQST